MAIIKAKEAVWIDDGVNDNIGTLLGWIDVSDQVDEDKNFEAYKYVFMPPTDTNLSWIRKFTGGLWKALYRLTDSEAVASYAYEISDSIIPKPAIDGFPKGKTIDGFEKGKAAPEKRVIIREDADGNSGYRDNAWNDQSGKSTVELEEELEEKKQRLNAARSRIEELEEELGREEDQSVQNNEYFPGEDTVQEGDQF